MKKSTETKETVAQILTDFLPYLNEYQKRIFAAIAASAVGHGGIDFVHCSTGVAKTTILTGIRELKREDFPAANFQDNGHFPDAEKNIQDEAEPDKAAMRQGVVKKAKIRRSGGGRKNSFEKYPELLDIIEEIISPKTYGNPENPLKWTSASLRKIAAAVLEKGIKISQNVVANALDKLGYSRQQNQKMEQIGSQHPDRNAQFEYINEKAGSFLNDGCPVISVDTKKKENVGNFKNNGSEYRPSKEARKVLDHDFPLPELGKVAPYGVYVLNNNTGFINLGTSSDTAEFAGYSVLRWWECIGKETFPDATKIYITCDGGGSNGSRTWLWKYYLQELSDMTGLEIHVSHFPPGTSKWNKIEHRLFCYISKNWQGQPLIDIETIVNLIGSTTTQEGLKVICKVDENKYQKGLKITEEEREKINIEFMGPNEKWNYIIRPRMV